MLVSDEFSDFKCTRVELWHDVDSSWSFRLKLLKGEGQQMQLWSWNAITESLVALRKT